MRTSDVHFAAVRGLLTARALGLSRDVAICDPGFLVGQLWPQPRADRGPVGFVPHVYSEAWSTIGPAVQAVGIEVISPSLPLGSFLQKLAACSRVYCESLHAAIFADALRIPWARVRLCSHFYEGSAVSDLKWQDAFSVFDVPTEPVNRWSLIPTKRSWTSVTKTLAPLRSVMEHRMAWALATKQDDLALFKLSDERRLRARTQRLLARIEDVRLPARVAVHMPAAEAAKVSEGCRVLVFPKSGQNPFLQQFAQSLEDGGARVEDFNFWRAFFGHYDVLHLHWPESHLRTTSLWRSVLKHARFAALCAWSRARGIRVVWMLHNLRPHDGDLPLSAWLFKTWFPRACSHIIGLTHGGLEEARRLYPSLRDKPATVAPHGHYRSYYAQPPPRAECRSTLQLQNAFTYLFIGNIRPYKNVPQLIAAFAKLPSPNVQLVIAGIPVLGTESREIETLAAGDKRIELRLQYIADEQIPLYLGAADVVVLPFQGVLNSGSTLLALSFNRRVLAARVGALPEVQSKVGSGWLQLYEGPLTTKLLENAQRSHVDHGDDDQPDLSAYEWDSIAQKILTFYASSAKDLGAEPATVETS
jgi:glycosyltransferase involved in cell wall biosynthesis